MSEDLNVVDPAKPCVPLPELVPIVCPACLVHGMASLCSRCGELHSVLVDKAKLKVWE